MDSGTVIQPHIVNRRPLWEHFFEIYITPFRNLGMKRIKRETSTGLLIFWLEDHPQLLDTEELWRNEIMKQNQSVFDSAALTDAC